MKTREKALIIGVLIVAFAGVMFVTRPTWVTAQSAFIAQWLRDNMAASSDGVSLKIEYSPTSEITGDFSSTSTVEDILEIERTSSGTPANGIGTGFAMKTETAAGNVETGITLDAVTTDVTATSEDFDFVIGAMDAGAAAAERWRIDSGGVITQSAESAATNAVVDVMNLKHGTSGTEANGIGLGLVFTQEVTSGDEIAANLDVVATDVTAASEDFSYIFSLMAAGAAAAQVLEIQSTGVLELVNAGTIDNTTDGIITIGEPSSATNTVVDIAKISHTTSGTPANNIGVGVALEVETAAGNNEVGATIDAVALDTTATSEDFSIILSTMAAGAAAAERVEISSTAVELSTALDLKACTIAADDTTPDVTGCTWLTTSANTGATAITDLDNPVVGALYCIVGGSATNSSTIADSGNFALSGAFTAGLDDVLCLYVQADNDYIEISVSDN